MALRPMNEFDELKPVYGSKFNENFANLQLDMTDMTTDYDGKITNLNNTVTSLGSTVNNLQATIISALYPVGSLYITASTQGTCPIASLIPNSTWTRVSTNRVLQGGNSATDAGGTKAAGLPNITGNKESWTEWRGYTGSGALSGAYATGSDRTQGGTGGSHDMFVFNARNSNSIYGQSSTVQPPAYLVNIWQRTA